MYLLPKFVDFVDGVIHKKTTKKLEAKDVLPNINRTQAAERAEKFRFLSLV